MYNCWAQRMETLEATDPYSRSLAADGARTQASPLPFAVSSHLLRLQGLPSLVSWLAL